MSYYFYFGGYKASTGYITSDGTDIELYGLFSRQDTLEVLKQFKGYNVVARYQRGLGYKITINNVKLETLEKLNDWSD